MIYADVRFVWREKDATEFASFTELEAAIKEAGLKLAPISVKSRKGKRRILTLELEHADVQRVGSASDALCIQCVTKLR